MWAAYSGIMASNFHLIYLLIFDHHFADFLKNRLSDVDMILFYFVFAGNMIH